MQVDENKNLPISNYHGTRYTFCAQQCKEKFDKNPQQYVSQAQHAGQAQSQQSGQSRQAGQGQSGGQSQQSSRSQQERTKTGGGGIGD
jgi:YHS domain-containing protein